MRHAAAAFLLTSSLAVALAGAPPTAAMPGTQVGSDIYGEARFDFSGSAVDMSANGLTIVVGAPQNNGTTGGNAGHARVFRHDGNDWTQLGSDIDGEAFGDNSGHSVAMSADGNTVVIGSPFNDGNGQEAGHARVFRFNGIEWTQLGSDIDGEDRRNRAGFSVDISADGNTIAVGSPGDDNVINGPLDEDAGKVRVLEFNGVDWTALGADIRGEAEDDNSGHAVAISGDGKSVVIGAPGNSDNGTAAGHARIYRYDGVAWSQRGSDIDGEMAVDESGFAVDISDDGSVVIVGAPLNDGTASDAGHARVFEFDGTDWSQVGTDIDGEAEDDWSGSAVAISDDGSTVVVGARFAKNGVGEIVGHARVLRFTGSDWSAVTADLDGDDIGDNAGRAVGIDGDGQSVIVGHPSAAVINGDAEGMARVFDVSPGPTCDGLPATIFGAGVINGTGGPDVIVGSPGADTITGFGSDDIICGRGGNDIIIDFAGNDRLFGGPGNDRITAGNGDDTLFGGPGDDVLKGENGNDTIWGGNDDDDLVGGNDDDLLIGGFGDDRFRGGPGFDTASYAGAAGPVTVQLNNTPDDGTILEADDVQTSMEVVNGSRFDDVLIGSNGAETLLGNAGDDRLFGRNGNDVLRGGGGNDFIVGGAGDDFLSGDGDVDRCEGGAGNDFASGNCEIANP